MSNYLQETAARIRDAVSSEVEIPSDSNALFLVYAVLLRVKGEDVEAVDVHDAWAAWMTNINPDHDALRPFEQLDAETQAFDEPFVAAIRQAAREANS